MADPFAALAPELRALGGGATPEEIQGVLAYLLTQEGVQAGLEPLAATLVEQGGYGSLVALANMGREGLAELGMSACRGQGYRARSREASTTQVPDDSYI